MSLSNLCDMQWAYALGGPIASAILKASPEDFIVEEQLGFEADDEGDHYLVSIRKSGQNTQFVLEELARQLAISPRDISYSGLKDRHALTTQWYSLLMPGRDFPEGIGGEGWQILSVRRHRRKLRRGTHRGNRFTLCLHQLEADPSCLEQRLCEVRDNGVPNYFGEQRFGRARGNLQEADRLCAQLGQQKRRGRLNHREGLYMSAARSALFNQLLSGRVAEGVWNRYLAGDVLMLNGRHSFFMPEAEELPEVNERLRRMDIHPTGFLPGAGASAVRDEVLAKEDLLMEAYPELAAALESLGMESQRRALRVVPEQMQWQIDEDCCRVQFLLPSGAFATAVLREIFTLKGAEEPGIE